MKVFVYLVVLTLMATSGADDTESSFQTMVLSEISALKSKVTELEHELKAKERENLILNQHLQHSKRESSFFPENEVAFTARVSQHLTSLTAHQPIVFGSVLTNVGNYYNSTTGVFYVPIDGTYQFFVNILSEADNFIETELVVNGTGVAEIYSGAGKYNGAGSNLVIVRLHRGDKVWVKVHYGFSSDMSVHCCWSTFSGVLLRVVADLNQIVG